MHIRLSGLVLLASLAACSDKYDTDTGVVGSNDGATDGTGDGTGGADDPFNTLLEGLIEDDACAGYDGVEVTGATVFWYGEFDISSAGTGWSGVERSYHLANDAWEAAGQGDCQITWRVTASETEAPSQCASCSYGMALQASLDSAQTDCPAELWSTEQSYSVTYGVFEGGDGEVSLYFGDSGNFWTDGLVNGRGDLRYLRDSVCRWY